MSTWFSVVTQNDQDSNRNASDSDRLYCPLGQSGYFADPTNCNRYAQCNNGRRTAFRECPPDRHWRVTGVGYGYCDLPESAECQLIGVPVPAPDLPDPVNPVKQCNMLNVFYHVNRDCFFRGDVQPKLHLF